MTHKVNSPTYTNVVLEQLKTHWGQPAIEVEVSGHATQLGEGKANTKVILHDSSLLRRLVTNPSMTFGEGYMNGDIEIKGELLDVLQGFHNTGEKISAKTPVKLFSRLRKFSSGRIGREAAIHNAQHHYDIGNDFYKLWLDPTLAYTCAYYAHENDDLETAQRQKFELVCRKIRLQPGQTLIDIGCGWGGFLFHAAEHYGAKVHGIVAAKEQGRYIQEEAKRRGLADKVTVEIGDWREAKGQYDRVVSIGIMEHVGPAHYAEFFAKYQELLKEGGIAFTHTIGRITPGRTDPWITTYIFPGGHIPALEQMVRAAGAEGLMPVDIENLWQHYSLTLRDWSANYKANWDKVVAMHDDKFARMWWLYLQGSEAAFRWAGLHLFQMVMLKDKSVSWPFNREVNTGALMSKTGASQPFPKNPS